jgi:cytochrome c peroxidase
MGDSRMRSRIKWILTLLIINVSFAEPIDISEFKEEYVRPDSTPFPADNVYSEIKVQLGKALFFDPRLSKSGTQSCATCHNPSFSWGDGLPVGVGYQHQKLGRKSPTILNLAWDELYMWDGRNVSLEDQALGPVESPAEMGMEINQVPIILGAIPGYVSLFKQAFPEDLIPVKNVNVAKAIATFERTIVSPVGRFDQWINGDKNSLSEDEIKGFILFNTKANCASCHSEWMFSDGSFHDIGLTSEDVGRGKYLPELEKMKYGFKTVGLRDIALRAPYMHDGSLATLDDVIDHYDSGFVKRPSLSVEIEPLGLTREEKKQLVAFLKALTGPDQLVTLPRLPR